MPFKVIQICDNCGAENECELESRSWGQYEECVMGDVYEALEEDWWHGWPEVYSMLCPRCAAELVTTERGVEVWRYKDAIPTES